MLSIARLVISASSGSGMLHETGAYGTSPVNEVVVDLGLGLGRRSRQLPRGPVCR